MLHGSQRQSSRAPVPVEARIAAAQADTARLPGFEDQVPKDKTYLFGFGDFGDGVLPVNAATAVEPSITNDDAVSPAYHLVEFAAIRPSPGSDCRFDYPERVRICRQGYFLGMATSRKKYCGADMKDGCRFHLPCF